MCVEVTYKGLSTHVRARGWFCVLGDSVSLLLLSRSVVSDSLQPYGLQCTTSLSFTVSRSLLRFLSAESVMPSNRLILCHPLFHLPSIFPSIGGFSNELALPIRWPTLCDPMGCNPPGSSVPGILQVRMLEWVAIPFSRGIFLI